MSECTDKLISEEYEEFTINLPVGYSYENFSEVTENDIHFYCNELTTDAGIQQWVKELGEQNYVEWRVARTHPQVLGVKCRYRIDYRCQHSSTWYEPNPTATKARKSKNNQCPSKLSIKRIQKSKYDGGKVSTVIYLRNQHNHPTGAATNLKYRDVGEKAKQKLKKLFASGHTPGSAHHVLRSEAFEEFGESYERKCLTFLDDGEDSRNVAFPTSVVADRNKVPDLSYCYNAFYKDVRKVHGSLRDDHKIEHSDNVEMGESSSPTEIPTNHSEHLEDTVLEGKPNAVAESLKNVFDDIVRRVSVSQLPGLLMASKVFCKNYNTSCKRERSLQTALVNFGRSTGRKGVVMSSTKTGVLPTRRKIHNMQKLRRLNSESATKVVRKDEITHGCTS